MNGFLKGTLFPFFLLLFHGLDNFVIYMLPYPYFLYVISIENHAEHGGTLNEHQLNRLVRLVCFYIFCLIFCDAEGHVCATILSLEKLVFPHRTKKQLVWCGIHPTEIVRKKYNC